MSRRLRASAIVAIGILAAGMAYADSQESAAIDATEKWLSLVDSGQFEASWEESASLFRNAVTASQWKASVSAARRPFGRFVSREFLSAVFAKALPGAPDGEYVVIQYRSVFENKQAAVETVTPMRDAGVWKVAGYYIK